MTKPLSSINDIAQMFHVTPERIREQYRANLKGLDADLTNAIRTGRKVRGMDARKIQDCINTITIQLGA